MPRLNSPTDDGDEVVVTIIDPVPTKPWVCDLLSGVIVWMVKEQQPAFVVPLLVMMEQNGFFRLHMQNCKTGEVVGWDMDLLGRGYDGSQLIAPCNNWEPTDLDQVDGVNIIDSVHHQYDLLAWVYEQFADKPFPGFRNGQLPEVAEAALTRNLRRAAARAENTMPKPTTPQYAEHPDLPVPYERPASEMSDLGALVATDVTGGHTNQYTSEELIQIGGEPIANREARGEITDGDDGTYRVK